MDRQAPSHPSLPLRYSGSETRERAALLAAEIGAVHTSICIDKLRAAFGQTFADVEVHSGGVPKGQMNLQPKMKNKPATYGEVTQNLALQNIQVRPRPLLFLFLSLRFASLPGRPLPTSKLIPVACPRSR
jgi:hypothetical protein